MVKDTLKLRNKIEAAPSLPPPGKSPAKKVAKVLSQAKAKVITEESSEEDDNNLSDFDLQVNSSEDNENGDEDEGLDVSDDDLEDDEDEDDEEDSDDEEDEEDSDDEEDEEDSDDDDDLELAEERESDDDDEELEFIEEGVASGNGNGLDSRKRRINLPVVAETDSEDEEEEEDEESESEDDGENDLDLNELGSLNFEEFAEAVVQKESRKSLKSTPAKASAGSAVAAGGIALPAKVVPTKNAKPKVSKSKAEKQEEEAVPPEPEVGEKEDDKPTEVPSSSKKAAKASRKQQIAQDKKQEINAGGLVRLQRKIREQQEENEKVHPDPKNDEYLEDSSDEEDIRNTIGNVPLNWYDEYPHIGYDLDGKKLLRPQHGDKLDEFLSRMEDPNFWRTVKDKQTGQNVILSDQDMNLIRRIQSGNLPDPNFNDYAPWIDWFSSEVMETPLKAVPLSKTSFLPSKIDKMKISKMVHAIKMGWMKPKKKPPTEPQFYMLWDSDDKSDGMRRIHDHIPAPKTRLPGNAESYNPPPEYLFDDYELAAWKAREDEPWKRKYNFIPQKYPKLRNVPAYDKFIKERFERCLDLYLCPRAKKMRLTIKAEDLVPQLPNPKDLQPYPTTLSVVYKGHTGMVRSISMEPDGQFFATGSADGTVKIWEVQTGRCLNTFTFEGTVRSVEWCPNKSLALVAVAVENEVAIINPGVGDKLIVEKTDALLRDAPDMGEYVPSDRVAAACTWEPVDEEKRSKNIRLIIKHFKPVRQVTWHGRGDYFASVMPDGQNRSVIIHQLSTRKSQIPLSRSKGLVQCVAFHPIRPCFFVATQRHIRIYDLVKQELVKKLMTGQKWISSIAIHPKGDNVIVGGYDKKVTWFDLDLSTKPYQTLRHHGNAVRSVAYHKRYPLFASGSDDCSVIVCHGMVYNDLLQNPLIVPVKKLHGHKKENDFGVLSVTFHNLQPWVFSTGADHTIRLFT